jgi:hypothetical protein
MTIWVLSIDRRRARLDLGFGPQWLSRGTDPVSGMPHTEATLREALSGKGRFII